MAPAPQRSMLPAPRQVGHLAAVRCRPAVGAPDVCGDWDDLVDLVRGHRTGVSVGDAVGHGLEAAGVMGRLRSALTAASRVAAGPAEALDVVARYALVVDGAESATVVTTFVVGFDRHTIDHSSAGHPPPVPVHPDGRVEFLGRATGPPLDARLEPVRRPGTTTTSTPGATLVLSTDGLVERRREDIDTGLLRLAYSLRRHRTRGPESPADIVLRELLPPGGVTDDTAPVVVRL
ncbi:serine phosphatase RsbU (regulator of sigma subunit) [Streptomyces sp. TE5632]